MSDAQGGLSLLVETERRLDEELAAARAQAEGLRADARAAASAIERQLDAEVAAAMQVVRDEVALEREQRLAAIADEARRETEGYRGIGDERVIAIARGLVSRLASADG